MNSLAPHRSWKTAVVTVCVMLSVIFAGASAASGVDRVQHQSQLPGQHEHAAFSDLGFDDHHQAGDQEADARESDDLAGSGGAAADAHKLGSGHHHHTDGPAGIVATGQAVNIAGAYPAPRQAVKSDRLARNDAAPSPERPPKSPTISL